MIMHIAAPSGRLHCGTAKAGKFVTTEAGYDDEVQRETRLCKNCVRNFRFALGERGFLWLSRFEAREYPEAIWIHEEVIVGPFCVHCGNPFSMHGPGLRCRNHRIHPLLPIGDLPRAGSGFQGVKR